MIRLSYTLKCWALGVTYFLVFYFMVVMSDPGFSKYIYMLALSTVLFNGLLPSLLINVVIWILTPFIVALTVIAFVLYSMGVLTEKISH